MRLKDLTKDEFIYSESRYKVKRYAYHPFNWVDKEGKRETERVFSFILHHGNTWDNSTNLNFKESELHRVIDTYRGVIDRVRAERRELLTKEREQRKQYPIKTEWIFDNVTITAIEEMGYYDRYPAIDKKIVTLYANGMPYEYSGRLHPQNDIIDTNWMFSHAATSKVRKYNSYNVSFNRQYKETNTHKMRGSFVPLFFYIGYVINHKGQAVTVRDIEGTELKTDAGNIPMTLEYLQGLEVIGETQDITTLITKLQYCD